MRRLLLTICYLGIAFGGYWFASSLVQPESSSGLWFDSINRQDTRIYSEHEKQELSAKVNLAWDRIETKLKEIAPASLEVLNGPATEAEFEFFKEKLGMDLPPDFEASLRRHNGSNSAFGVFNMHSLHGIVYDYARLSHEEVTDWPASFWSAAFNHEEGKWEPGALNVGWNYFGMIVDREQNDITLVLSSRNYSGPHHDSFLASLEYIADVVESEDPQIEKDEDGRDRLRLDGWGCKHY